MSTVDAENKANKIISILERYHELLEKQLQNKKNSPAGGDASTDQTDRAQYNNHRVPPVEPPNDEGV